MKKKITAILMVILIGIMAAGCGQQQKTEQSKPDKAGNCFCYTANGGFSGRLFCGKEINFHKTLPMLCVEIWFYYST
mgnify:CR=1 FL=1